MTDSERKQPAKASYWTVDRVTEIIERLKSKYPEHAEDSAEVCALFEYRKLLRQNAASQKQRYYTDLCPSETEPSVQFRVLDSSNDEVLAFCFNIIHATSIADSLNSSSSLKMDNKRLQQCAEAYEKLVEENGRIIDRLREEQSILAKATASEGAA